MKNSCIVFLIVILGACSSPKIKHTDLANMNLKGKVKTLTEFTSNKDDNSTIVKTVWNFDINGNLMSELVYRNDQLVKKTFSMYDQKGRKTQDQNFTIDGDAMQTFEYRYDENGQALKTTVLENGASQRTGIEYDESGRMLEEKQFDKLGKLNLFVQYKYNDKGQLAEKKFIRLRGLQIDKNAEGYDANKTWGSGSEKARNEARSDYYTYTYIYDEKGNPDVEKCLNADGSVTYSMQYQYGEQEMNYASMVPQTNEPDTSTSDIESLTRMTYYDNIFRKFPKTPPYDHVGNWINRTTMDKHKNILSLTTRVIEYY